jgi:16S rRNA processing protein RimM
MVVMGRVAIPYGVQGWVKIQPFTEIIDSLLDYPEWWMSGKTDWQLCDVEEVGVHGKSVIAKFAGCNDRTAAFALKGKDIAVPRDDLPEPDEDEYYWSDLIGLEVQNLQSQDFGQVKEVFATGANDVLVVQGEGKSSRERLIPFTEQVVQKVDLAAKQMLVDWDSEF